MVTIDTGVNRAYSLFTMDWYEDPAELAKWRREAGLSQSELARRSARSRSVVRDVEVGRIKLRGELARSLWIVITQEHLKRAERSQMLERAAILRKFLDGQLREQSEQTWADAFSRLNALGQAIGVPVPPVQDHRSEETKARIETMERLIENQSKLIELYSSLTAEKDARILELEKQVADLRALYEAETEAALAYDKARELRAKVTEKVEG
jgi:predicted transcriptional regulator